MRRSIFVLLLLTLFTRQTALAQLLQQENLTHYNLNGKVKSFTEVSKSIAPDALAPMIKQTCLFNPDRNIVKLEVYDNTGLRYQRDYTYTPFGYTYVKKSKQNVKGKDTWISAKPRIYTYNDKTRKEETKGGGEQTEIGYYNEMGETDSIYVYSLSGKLTQKIRHLYNIGGNIIETNIFDPKGKLMEHYTYKWDKHGRKIFEQGFNSAIKFKYSQSHKYDQFDNEIAFHESAVTNGLETVTTIWTYAYRYDSHHNWINRDKRDDDGNRISSTERKIIYY